MRINVCAWLGGLLVFLGMTSGVVWAGDDDDDDKSTETSIADDMMKDEGAADGKVSDISKEKSEAILAFTGYMLETSPEGKIKMLLKAIDADPSATVPLGCFIREIEKRPDRRKYEDELVKVALRHPGLLRLNMAAAYLMSTANRHSTVIDIFNKTTADLNVKTMPERDIPYLLNLISIVGKSYLAEKRYEDGMGVFENFLDQPRLENNLKLLGFAALFYSASAEKASEKSGWFSDSPRAAAAKQRTACFDRVENICFKQYVDPNELVLLLDLCKQNNEARRGADLIYSLLLSKPNDLKSKLFLAVFYGSVERNVEAYRAWREIVRAEPTNFKFSLELGKAAERAGRYQVAAAAYRNYLRGARSDRGIATRLGLVALRAGDYQAALDAARDFPENPLNTYVAALACRQLKQYRQAAEWLTKTITVARKAKAEGMLDKEFYTMLAYCWERCGELEKGEDALREVLARHPNDANANNFLGYMWAARGVKLGPARLHIEKALKLEPDNPAINDSMAWVLYRSKDYKDAEKYIARSLKVSGKLPDAVILVHAGDIYQALGKNEEARRYWELALKIYSPEEEVNRQEVQEKLNRLPALAKSNK